MKCDAEAVFSDISPVVWFCSATAPLTFANTGRIASIACEMCTASTEPGGVPLQRLDLPGNFLRGALGLHRERLDLGCDNGKASCLRAARAASMVELSARSVVCRAICAIRLTTLPIAAEDPSSDRHWPWPRAPLRWPGRRACRRPAPASRCHRRNG